jgi:hypothetical protein
MGIKDVGDVGVVSSAALLVIKHTFNSASYVMDTESVLSPRSWIALAYLIDALEVTPCHISRLNRSNPLIAKVAFVSLNLENFPFMEDRQEDCSLIQRLGRGDFGRYLFRLISVHWEILAILHP